MAIAVGGLQAAGFIAGLSIVGYVAGQRVTEFIYKKAGESTLEDHIDSNHARSVFGLVTPRAKPKQ